MVKLGIIRAATSTYSVLAIGFLKDAGPQKPTTGVLAD
jgi:hypothetical protein